MGDYKKGGGATKREGGASEVLPLQKWGAEKGGTTSFEIVLTRKLEVLAIKGRGGGGTHNFWEKQNVLDLRFSHFVALPIINDGPLNFDH